MTDMELARRLVRVYVNCCGDAFTLEHLLSESVRNAPVLPWATAIESIPARDFFSDWTEDNKLRLLERLPDHEE